MTWGGHGYRRVRRGLAFLLCASPVWLPALDTSSLLVALGGRCYFSHFITEDKEVERGKQAELELEPRTLWIKVFLLHILPLYED